MSRSIIVALALVCSVVSARADQDCALKKFATLALEKVGESYAVPVTIDGQERRMLFGLHVPLSGIDTDYAVARGFSNERVAEHTKVIAAHQPVRQLVTVPNVKVGMVNTPDIRMIEIDHVAPAESGIVGVLGLDWLSHFDIELDLARSQVTLYSQVHCPGQVVYWTDAYVDLPFKTDQIGDVRVPMQLDGKEVSVGFSVTQAPASMGMHMVKRLFDIDATSQGMKALPVPSGEPAQYRYPFQKLDIDGLTIVNPKIDIVDDSKGFCDAHHARKGADDVPKTCLGDADLWLRADELKHLRLYFAFDEKKLYVTAADAAQKEK